MSQQLLVTTTDDLDGTEGAATVKFALDGHAYEIDLTDGHAAEFRLALGQYAASARPVQAKHARRSVQDRERAVKIRSWARKNGHEVGSKGRIPGHVEEAFSAALRNTRTLM